MGDEPPIFTAAKVLDDVEGEVTLDLEFKWVAIKPEVILDVKAADFHLLIKLEHIEAFGVVRLVFTPLVPWWPSFDGMKIAFVDKPTIDFSLKLIGGDINTIPFVANSLRHLITNSLVDLMVWPQKDLGTFGRNVGEREREHWWFVENRNSKCRVGEWHKRFGKEARERDDEFQIDRGGRSEPEEREEKIHRSGKETVAGVRGTD